LKKGLFIRGIRSQKKFNLETAYYQKPGLYKKKLTAYFKYTKKDKLKRKQKAAVHRSSERASTFKEIIKAIALKQVN